MVHKMVVTTSVPHVNSNKKGNWDNTCMHIHVQISGHIGRKHNPIKRTIREYGRNKDWFHSTMVPPWTIFLLSTTGVVRASVVRKTNKYNRIQAIINRSPPWTIFLLSTTGVVRASIGGKKHKFKRIQGGGRR